MKLIPVDPANEAHLKVLYDLLAERTPEQSISHKKMPTWEEHCAFVRSAMVGYQAWYLIEANHPTAGLLIIGSIYLTGVNEIGVQLWDAVRGSGYGGDAVNHLIDEHGPRRYLANINPANEPSRKMFEKLGFKLVQHTYTLEAE